MEKGQKTWKLNASELQSFRRHSIKDKYDYIKDITTWVWEQAADFQFQKYSKSL